MTSSPSATKLFTIGYEGRTLESYLDALAGARVTLLCDVRRDPVSRKPGFSKRKLAESCEGAGIRYVHLPALGIDAQRRKAAKTEEDMSGCWPTTCKDLPRLGAELEKIRGFMQAGERVALTCYERAPEQCHRSQVADAVVSGAAPDFTIEHL